MQIKIGKQPCNEDLEKVAKTYACYPFTLDQQEDFALKTAWQDLSIICQKRWSQYCGTLQALRRATIYQEAFKAHHDGGHRSWRDCSGHILDLRRATYRYQSLDCTNPCSAKAKSDTRHRKDDRRRERPFPPSVFSVSRSFRKRRWPGRCSFGAQTRKLVRPKAVGATGWSNLLEDIRRQDSDA